MNTHEESKTYVKPEMTLITLQTEGGLCGTRMLAGSFDGSGVVDDDEFGYPE